MATATSAWAKPGAWALESEEQAAMQKENPSSAFPSITATASDPSADFPSLAAAAASKPSKKKKPQAVSLSEFAGGKPVSHGAAARSRTSDVLSSYSKGLTQEELVLLPTGPRERSAEELERSSRGFGYSSYGNGGARRMDGSTSRVSSDETRRNPINRDFGPSRADEVDDWGSMKKSAAFPERRERAGGFFDCQSRADEVDTWISKRNTAPPADGAREKRGGFEMFGKERSVTDSDSWGRKKEDASRGDSDTWGRKREEINGTGGGRPRLVLQPRSVPLANGNTDTNGEVYQGEKHSPVTKNKGSNPFGQARPREEVLAEKGQDWKTLDQKLDSMKIREGVHDGPYSGRKGPGSSNGSLPEDRTERSWRKEDALDVPASITEEHIEARPI